MAVLGSVERQFAAMASNAGVWEGNLASYDRAGTVKSPKVPTILYVYCDSKDDAAKVAAGQAPYKVRHSLRASNACFHTPCDTDTDACLPNTARTL